MPLAYLKHNILRELFRLSEEEYGLSSDGPITLPCNAAFMEYVVTLLRQGVPKDLEKALLRSETKLEAALVWFPPLSSIKDLQPFISLFVATKKLAP
ncbi:hypothetical protein TIFTF001_007497 [Ficus carica]|uniref:Small auxin up regulated protein n=1 Tax=Ficus carica TaxID=3494 RepID=A0AA87ZQG5_FICCA|nr:hypothetical protein TIFTF001_007497 [Ficus carica]